MSAMRLTSIFASRHSHNRQNGGWIDAKWKNKNKFSFDVLFIVNKKINQNLKINGESEDWENYIDCYFN